VTVAVGGGVGGAQAPAAGWLRPVRLRLASAVRAGEGTVWPDPATFVWRSAGDDQERRRAALEALLEPTASIVTDGPVLAVYRITAGDRRQTGLLADVAVDAYEAGRIRGHEHTRREKEEALFAELDAVEALVGPVALAHRPEPALATLLDGLAGDRPTAAWTTADRARHELWVVEGDRLEELTARSAALDPLYIVDGHHRIAAAVRRAASRRDGARPEADDPWGAFLAAVFPADQLTVRATHRVVELDGADPAAVRDRIGTCGRLTPVDGLEAARPRAPREFGVGLAGSWYRLEGLALPPDGPVPYTDVQALDEHVLGPVLGVEDPRTDPRLDFVPDVGGLDRLARRSRDGRAAVFLVHAVTVDEVLAVADAGAALPPKSTWFDPKPIKGAALPAARLPTGAADPPA
jgi:uncharacterized protein (DUF1015 family)